MSEREGWFRRLKCFIGLHQMDEVGEDISDDFGTHWTVECAVCRKKERRGFYYSDEMIQSNELVRIRKLLEVK